MALTESVLTTFARLSTRRQVDAIKRAGIETEAADVVLGHLAGNHPDRYRALLVALGE